jgi:hypothetical protein
MAAGRLVRQRGQDGRLGLDDDAPRGGRWFGPERGSQQAKHLAEREHRQAGAKVSWNG